VNGYKGPKLDILVDQGEADQFLKEQLLPANLQGAVDKAKAAGQPVSLQLRMHKGYDHSYFFIATFVEDHIKHHAKYLNA